MREMIAEEWYGVCPVQPTNALEVRTRVPAC